MLENCEKKNMLYRKYVVLIIVFLAMIASKYIDIIYLTGDLLLICK